MVKPVVGEPDGELASGAPEIELDTRAGLVARGHAGLIDAFVHTIKLSPQPHAPLALGLSNTKPAAKSSSHQSITLPTR